MRPYRNQRLNGFYTIRTCNMHILVTLLSVNHSDLADKVARVDMSDSYSQDKGVFRGGKKAPYDNRTILNFDFDSKTHRSRLRLQRWLMVILIFLLTSLIIINIYSTDQIRSFRFNAIINETLPENFVEIKPFFTPVAESGFVVYTQGCRIPAMDPFDPSIKRFIRKEDPITCEHGNHAPLVDSNDTAIFVNLNATQHFYNRSDEMKCCCRPFKRMANEDNIVIYSQDCYQFHESMSINNEFVKIECSRDDQIIYKDYHAFLPRFRSIEKKCEKARAASSKTEYLSTLIVGLDSISRMNFHRMMPKTAETLKKLGAVEMLGYTKVADNTYPNLVAVLTGLSDDEIGNTCWQTKDKPFDDCPFLWKNFSAEGYKTVFGEDACSMTTFNYLKPGFKVQPTDYYLRPFCIASEKDIGNTHKLNANLCVGTRKTFDNLLHYTKKTASKFVKDPYFAMFWQASLTHDFFNYPQLGDDSYRDFLVYLSENQLLNQTALIVMSDHGMRWGDFRETYQGRMEDSLPFVFIVLPNWWQDKYQVAWANLRKNSKSLTTAFDLHETLIDLLYSEKLEESSLKNRIDALSRAETLPRGVSWFSPIPNYRTCSMAGIASHWCMCHSSNDVPLDDRELQDRAKFLVRELNRMLKKYSQCATLKLKEIRAAKMWRDKAKTDLIDYTITLQTEPGDAIFEGTVRSRGDDGSKKLVGTVSRLNAYGKQSACMNEFNMRLYCYCL